jgi:hypothetical protein
VLGLQVCTTMPGSDFLPSSIINSVLLYSEDKSKCAGILGSAAVAVWGDHAG